MNTLLVCCSLESFASPDRANVIIVAIVCCTILLLALVLSLFKLLGMPKSGTDVDKKRDEPTKKPEMTEEESVRKEERNARKEFFSFCYKMIEKEGIDVEFKRECWEILKSRFDNAELRK